jgi:hypothetical protein
MIILWGHPPMTYLQVFNWVEFLLDQDSRDIAGVYNEYMLNAEDQNCLVSVPLDSATCFIANFLEMNFLGKSGLDSSITTDKYLFNQSPGNNI